MTQQQWQMSIPPWRPDIHLVGLHFTALCSRGPDPLFLSLPESVLVPNLQETGVKKPGFL